MTHRRSRPKKTPPQIFAPGGESLQFYIYPLTEQKQTIQKLIEVTFKNAQQTIKNASLS